MRPLTEISSLLPTIRDETSILPRLAPLPPLIVRAVVSTTKNAESGETSTRGVEPSFSPAITSTSTHEWAIASRSSSLPTTTSPVIRVIPAAWTDCARSFMPDGPSVGSAEPTRNTSP